MVMITVLANPSAGSGEAVSVAAEVADALRLAKFDARVLVAETSEELRTVASAAAVTSDALVAVGGDGMVNLAAGIAVSAGIPLGLVPVGSGNDFARSLKISRKRRRAIERLVSATAAMQPTSVDVMRIRSLDSHGLASEQIAVQVVNLAFDSAVNFSAQRNKAPAELKYVFAVFRELWRYKFPRFDIELDGLPIRRHVAILAVQNGPSFGGGMRAVPHASVTDGKLDIFTVTPINKLKLLLAFPLVFAGLHGGLREVSHLQARMVRVVEISTSGTEPGAGAASVDGEMFRTPPFDIEVVPGGLKVLR